MSGWVDDSNAALLTDFYELTMLQAYFDSKMDGIATFDLFIRHLPPERNYFVACGLEHVLHYLETLAFSSSAIEYLQSLNRFSQPFLERLRSLRFTGSVLAVPEGTVVFPQEPILQVRAPLPEAQLVETFLMNQIQLGTLGASKAARVVHAARGRPVIDFGLRRLHGADAGLKEPRAFYIAGVQATSSVLAGQMYGIPVAGTIAHSYIQSFEDEKEAFRRFLHSFPEAILLVDTYDTVGGVRRVIELSRELGSDFRVHGIRLDSGDLADLARRSRALLDANHLKGVKIFASSSVDEFAIEDLLSAGAPIDGFGVGAHMGVSADAPFLDTAYKLAEYAGEPRMKMSVGKSSFPGRKQVFRQRAGDRALCDVIALDNEKIDGQALLRPVMLNGRRMSPSEGLDICRERCRTDLASLSPELLDLRRSAASYPVHISPELTKLRTSLQQKLIRKNRSNPAAE